jgi:hypothetical protein
MGMARYFVEWQSPDRGRNRIEATEKDSQESMFNEIVSVGGQTFARSHESGWREQLRLGLIRSEWPYSPPVIYLDAPDIELVSANEITDEGVKVFRLEFSEAPRPASTDTDTPITENFLKPEIHTTLLISQETFRFVSVVDKSRMPDGITADADGEPVLVNWTNTFELYDYNVPNVIEAPDEYVLWSEKWTTESQPSPLATPTAVPERNCSEPDATWPGCGVRTAADVEAMLVVFPDVSKIILDNDIVITFPFEEPPHVDWQADAFVWHVPSASVAQLCYANLTPEWMTPTPDLATRLSGTGMQSKSPEGAARLQQILDDEAVTDQIRSRAGAIEVQCVFSG